MQWMRPRRKKGRDTAVLDAELVTDMLQLAGCMALGRVTDATCNEAADVYYRLNQHVRNKDLRRWCFRHMSRDRALEAIKEMERCGL